MVPSLPRTGTQCTSLEIEQWACWFTVNLETHRRSWARIYGSQVGSRAGVESSANASLSSPRSQTIKRPDVDVVERGLHMHKQAKLPHRDMQYLQTSRIRQIRVRDINLGEEGVRSTVAPKIHPMSRVCLRFNVSGREKCPSQR